MSKSALTLEEVFEEAGFIARWEARGMEKEKLEIAAKMKATGFSNEQIQTATGLPQETIERIV